MADDLDPSGTIRGLTEDDANAILLAIAKGGKKAREALNFAMSWKTPWSSVMAPRTGLGDFLMGEPKEKVGGPEGFESYAYGFGGPWHVPEGKVLPELRPGQSEQAVNMMGSIPLNTGIDVATAGKAGMTATVPFAIGQVRKLNDQIPKEVASEIASRLLRPQSIYSTDGYRSIDKTATRAQGTAPQDLIDKATQYVQRFAGGPSDPLKKTPMFQSADPGFYPNVNIGENGVPLFPPEPNAGMSTSDAAEFRQKVRPDLEAPSSTYMGSAVDDLIAQSLNSGKAKGELVRGTSDLAGMAPEELERLNRILYAAGHGENLLGARAAEGAKAQAESAVKAFSESTGIESRDVHTILGTLKEDGIIAAKPDDWEISKGLDYLSNTLGSPKFWDFWKAMPDSEKSKLSFGDFVNLYVKDQQHSFDDWGKNAVGPVVGQTADGKAVWMDLNNSNSMLWQGIKSDICVGQEHYTSEVANGSKKVFGLRDAKTGKPFATLDMDLKPSKVQFPEQRDTNTRLIDLASTMTPEQKAAFGDELGKAFAMAYEGNPNHSYADSIKQHIIRGEKDQLDAYTGALISSGQSILGRGEAQRDALIKYFNMAGFNLTPESLKPKQVWQLEQVKGARNAAGSNIPAPIREEISRFIDEFLGPQLSLKKEGGQYRDYESLKDAMKGSSEATGRFLTEAEVDRITKLYKQIPERGTKYGMPWMNLPGEGTFTLDRGQLMKSKYQNLDDTRLDKLYVPDQGSERIPGKVMTEIARRLKGTDAMPDAVKNQIAESMVEIDKSYGKKVDELAESYSWRKWEQQKLTDPEGREVLVFRQPNDGGYFRGKDGEIYWARANNDGTLRWDRAEQIDPGDFTKIEGRLIKNRVDKMYELPPEVAAKVELVKTKAPKEMTLTDWNGQQRKFITLDMGDGHYGLYDPHNDDLLVAGAHEVNGVVLPNVQDAQYVWDVEKLPAKVKQALEDRKQAFRDVADGVNNAAQAGPQAVHDIYNPEMDANVRAVEVGDRLYFMFDEGGAQELVVVHRRENGEWNWVNAEYAEDVGGNQVNLNQIRARLQGQ